MPSAADNVQKYLSNAIKEVVPTIKESPNTYDLEKNSHVDKFVYAVRPGSLSSTAGTNLAMTVIQSFEIEIQKEFTNNDNTDKKLKEVINSIYENQESIFKRISLRNANDVRILLIGDFSAGSPDINFTKKTVSITFTHQVTYRNHIKEGV